MNSTATPATETVSRWAFINNQEPNTELHISSAEAELIDGRGPGYRGHVVDQLTGKRFSIWGADCGTDCYCAFAAYEQDVSSNPSEEVNAEVRIQRGGWGGWLKVDGLACVKADRSVAVTVTAMTIYPDGPSDGGVWDGILLAGEEQEVMERLAQALWDKGEPDHI